VFEKYMRQRLLVAAATVDPSPAFQSLVVTQTFARNGSSHFQLLQMAG
jgi:hypothetical protein